jgi:hypothetical protein
MLIKDEENIEERQKMKMFVEKQGEQLLQTTHQKI